MATRQKYHRITVFPDEYGTDEPFMSLMDILKRPLLGQYVRHIKCCAPLPMYTAYEVTESQRGLNDEDMKLVQKAVRKAGFTGPDEQQVVNMLMQRRSYGMWTWFQENDHQKPRMTIFTQALTSILIAVSPSLVSMAITEPVCRGFGHPTEQIPLAEFLRWANSEPESKPFLQNLRDVYLINNNNSNRWDETCYQEMDFYGCCGLLDSLPSIESVSADLVENNSGFGKSKFVEKCSNISRMSLHHSAVGSVYLARLIWSCKSLREFQYSIGGRSPGDGEYPIVNPETLLKVLCGHKETLEILDLDCESGMDFLDEDNTSHIQQHETPFEPHIKKKQREFLKAIWSNGSSLKEFRALKRLGLGIKFLLYFAKGVSGESDDKCQMANLAECIPVSLEYLCVRGYEREVNTEHDEQMDTLMALYKSGSSNLNEVVGYEELIPHSDHVKPVDEDRLWSLQERDYLEF